MVIFNNVNYFYTIIGAIINLLMFTYISIPMEERHMKKYKTNLDKYNNKININILNGKYFLTTKYNIKANTTILANREKINFIVLK